MEKPYLSIIIPCYKEEKNLPKTFPVFEDFVKAQKYPIELIFVNDGSPDETARILHQISRDRDFVRVISYHQNQGKGYAVKFGMLKAEGKFRLFADADNATPIEQVEKLLKFSKDFNVVIGSRYIEEGHLKKRQPFYRILGARLLNFLPRDFSLEKAKSAKR